MTQLEDIARECGARIYGDTERGVYFNGEQLGAFVGDLSEKISKLEALVASLQIDKAEASGQLEALNMDNVRLERQNAGLSKTVGDLQATKDDYYRSGVAEGRAQAIVWMAEHPQQPSVNEDDMTNPTNPQASDEQIAMLREIVTYNMTSEEGSALTAVLDELERYRNAFAEIDAVGPGEPTKSMCLAMLKEAKFQFGHGITIDSAIRIYRAAMKAASKIEGND